MTAAGVQGNSRTPYKLSMQKRRTSGCQGDYLQPQLAQNRGPSIPRLTEWSVNKGLLLPSDNALNENIFHSGHSFDDALLRRFSWPKESKKNSEDGSHNSFTNIFLMDRSPNFLLPPTAPIFLEKDWPFLTSSTKRLTFWLICIFFDQYRFTFLSLLRLTWRT